ncbi:hypothetical protein RHSIM_Rhsim13G0015400 [Rhododendron simsii]|uniref:Uncharacterized protein n=1 Tax=Rhododendron simsii TaxID=118357 RepID=A0A834G1A7_RHOSS|nr:hypothetical protein RHSIM_Rhsim13G0015400 [Rhododendron simsii]
MFSRKPKMLWEYLCVDGGRLQCPCPSLGSLYEEKKKTRIFGAHPKGAIARHAFVERRNYGNNRFSSGKFGLAALNCSQITARALLQSGEEDRPMMQGSFEPSLEKLSFLLALFVLTLDFNGYVWKEMTVNKTERRWFGEFQVKQAQFSGAKYVLASSNSCQISASALLQSGQSQGAGLTLVVLSNGGGWCLEQTVTDSQKGIAARVITIDEPHLGNMLPLHPISDSSGRDRLIGSNSMGETKQHCSPYCLNSSSRVGIYSAKCLKCLLIPTACY